MKKVKAYLMLPVLLILLIACDSNIEEETIDPLTNSSLPGLPGGGGPGGGGPGGGGVSTNPCDDCYEYSTDNYINDNPISLQKKSVGLIYTDKNNINSLSRLCSGTLINNPNGKLYFLTAAHCLVPEVQKYLTPNDLTNYNNDNLTNVQLDNLISSINTSNLTNMVDWRIRFGYECNSDGDFLVDGLSLISLNPQTEMALFEINGLSFNTTENNIKKSKLCLSGWNRSTSNSSNKAIVIHHAAGDPQRVAISTNGYEQFDVSHQINNLPGYINKDNFWYLQANQGGFKNGSSGSGLINNNNELVGFLTGDEHFSGCETDESIFGKFSKAYDFSNTSLNKNRTLKHWIGNALSMGTDCFASTANTASYGASYLDIDIIYPNCSPNQLWCGRISLSWLKGKNVSYNVYRQVNSGVLVKIANLLDVDITEFEDEEARTWANSYQIRYFIESVDTNGNTLSPNGTSYTFPNVYRIHKDTNGGLISF